MTQGSPKGDQLAALKKSLANANKIGKVTESNKHDIKLEIKRSPILKMIIEEHPDLDMNNLDIKKYIDVRKAIAHLIAGLTYRELYTEIEMENWYWLLKDELMKKIQDKEEFTEKDYERLDIMFNHLKDLHKLIHGEKKIIAKIDFAHIRDLTKV